MGKSRKSSKQKASAKRANAANMQFFEETDFMEEQASAHGQGSSEVREENVAQKDPPACELLNSGRTDETSISGAGTSTLPLNLSVNDRLPLTVEDTPAQDDEQDDSVNAEENPVEVAAACDEGPNQKIERMEKENMELRENNRKYRVLNMKLQESLINKHVDLGFKELSGFPDANWLMSVSQNSGDSDYLFVKELVMRLFPKGIGKATVSGRRSNNPYGRRIQKDSPLTSVGAEVEAVGQIDPIRVEYIRARLYERRRILQDPVGLALELSNKVAKHIALVVANNRKLRTLID